VKSAVGVLNVNCSGNALVSDESTPGSISAIWNDDTPPPGNEVKSTELPGS
jgi:hypothetical protein